MVPGNGKIQSQTLKLYIMNTKSHPIFEKARKLYRKNLYSDALLPLNQYLATYPEDIHAMNMLGCCNVALSKFEKAHELFNKVIQLSPKNVDAIQNLAKLYLDTNNIETAINVLNYWLSFEENNTTARLMRANTFEKIKDYQSAINDYEFLIQQNNRDEHVILGLAHNYIQTDQLDKLLKFSYSLTDYTHQFNIATLCLTTKKAETARSIYENLLKNSSASANLLNNLASAYDMLNNTSKAKELYQKCIDINPDFIGAYSNLGRLLSDLNQLDEAKSVLNTALNKSPDDVNTNINLGRVYSLENNPEKALNCFFHAKINAPDNALLMYNIGNEKGVQGHLQDAEAYYRSALAIDPNYADAEFNLGLLELGQGKFKTAWGHYFKRLRNLEHGETLSSITPGMSYKNKRLYICYSQGLGDELFFLRFLPILKKQGCHITYRCQPKLFPLLQHLSAIDELITGDRENPICDYYFAVDDLPLILDMNNAEQIPTDISLNVNNTLHQVLLEKFKHLPRPFIGITWRAGTSLTMTDFRSTERHLNKEFPFERLLELSKGFQGSVFILQRNPQATELNLIKQHCNAIMLDVSEYNENLEDMLALLNLLDDTIAVSNTNIHLLAGIDKSAKLLIPYPPDWRWMYISDRSPWFPSMETFRQDKNGSWEQAILHLQHQLSNEYGFSY